MLTQQKFDFQGNKKVRKNLKQRKDLIQKCLFLVRVGEIYWERKMEVGEGITVEEALAEVVNGRGVCVKDLNVYLASEEG